MKPIHARPFDSVPLDAILALVQERTGLTFPPSRRSDAERGIRKILGLSGANDLVTLRRRLEEEPETFDALIALLTVGETYFFREPKQFGLMQRHIIPELLAGRGRDRKLLFWSAGCATGEEPYSMAILLDQNGWRGKASIIGSDIAVGALRTARTATYGAWSFRDCPEDMVARYFQKRGDRFSLLGPLSGDVSFHQHNLRCGMLPNALDGASGVHLILCRNVMIYFDVAAIRRTATLLFDALADGGWLITAPVDPPLADYAPLEPIMTEAGLVYRRIQHPADRLAHRTDTRPAVVPGPRRVRKGLVRATPTPVVIATAATSHDVSKIREVAHQAYAAGHFALAVEMTEGIGASRDIALLRIRALADAGASERATDEATVACQDYPLDPEVRYLRAIILIDRGLDDAAIACLRGVVYLDRSLAAAHFTLGTVLRRKGQIEKARRAFRYAYQICVVRPPDEVVPLTDAEPAARVAAAAQIEIKRLVHPVKEAS